MGDKIASKKLANAAMSPPIPLERRHYPPPSAVRSPKTSAIR
jgi:hypothetical protein